MARTKKATENKYKEFKYDGKEFQYTGRIYPDYQQETKSKKATITPISITLNSVFTIKGCKLFQTDNNAWIKFPEYLHSKEDNEYRSYIYYPEELNDEINELVKVIEEALDK